MIDTSMIVKQILKKRHMTNMDLVRAINKVEERCGMKERTVTQNITNYINGYFDWGYEFTRKVEVALELEELTLLNTLRKPKTEWEKKCYNEAIAKYKVVK